MADCSWVGVVGTLSGAVLGSITTYFTSRLTEKRQEKKERKRVESLFWFELIETWKPTTTKELANSLERVWRMLLQNPFLQRDLDERWQGKEEPDFSYRFLNGKVIESLRDGTAEPKLPLDIRAGISELLDNQPPKRKWWRRGKH